MNRLLILGLMLVGINSAVANTESTDDLAMDELSQSLDEARAVPHVESGEVTGYETATPTDFNNEDLDLSFQTDAEVMPNLDSE